MGEIIGVITGVEDDDYQGKEFKKVTLGDGQVLKVKYGKEGTLKAKWGELQVGRAYSFVMGSFKDKPFVQDFHAVEGKLLAPVQAKPVPEGNVPKTAPSKSTDTYADRDKRIEWQVVMKELGELYRGGFLDENNAVHKKYIAKYKNWINSVLGLAVEYKE